MKLQLLLSREESDGGEMAGWRAPRVIVKPYKRPLSGEDINDCLASFFVYYYIFFIKCLWVS